MTSHTAFIGQTFGGRYVVTSVLGEGAMGVVFRGVDQQRAEGIAVKILRPDVAENATFRARFAREATMAAQVDHPNAVRVFDQGVHDGIPYLVMELVVGRDLFDVLAEKGRLPAARAAAITIQICDAVATAHDRGIIHRDLKPENVMLVGDPASPEGERVKLLDFGVAKQLGCEWQEQNITVAGAIIGTPAYMSPEQCEGEPVDARSDVYACGAVLYHLVTGRPPFDDESPIRVLHSHVYDEPVRPGTLVRGLDRGLEATILRALAKRPADRHQSASELWEDLLAAISRLSSGAAPEPARRLMMAPTPCQPTWALPSSGAETSRHLLAARAQLRRASATRRRMPVVLGVVAVVGVALGLLGVMIRMDHRSAPSETIVDSSTSRALSLGR